MSELDGALEWHNCLLLLVAAAGIGISKSGFAGVGMLHVIIFAMIFGAKSSTGVLLPMLVIGDCCAIWCFGKSAQWKVIQRLLPPALLGVVLGTLLMQCLEEAAFRPLIGALILLLTGIQIFRIWRPTAFQRVPHATWFVWTLGILTGITTMLANAAGPVVALYLLAVSLPKWELVGTSAWFFLALNVSKLPFSYGLGLIDWSSLQINLLFAPGILLGMLVGKWLIHRVPQRAFDSLLLAFTASAALRLLLG